MNASPLPSHYLQDSAKSICDRYDAVVIGTGVGGLSCANYLAKGGLKVLAVEKHYVPGGYCSSFSRDGYYFDAGAHYLGSCRSGGQVGRLLSDHGLEGRITFIRVDPSDTLVTRKREVRVWQQYDRFVEELQDKFPREAESIRRFMDYVTQSNPLRLYAELKKKTFSQLLDSYFTDQELKSVLSIPLGNIAVPSTRASALTTVFLYREFVLDGGYYPKGGMQRLPDVLVRRFQEYGGDISYLTSAEKILTKNGMTAGVRLKVRGRVEVEVRTRIVVANCDPHQLANSLLGTAVPKHTENIGELLQRKASPSAVIVHLGVNRELRGIAKYDTNVWLYPGEHVDEYYEALCRGQLALEKGFLFYSIPTMHDPELLPNGKHSIQAIIGAPFKSRREWERGGLKGMVAEEVVRRIERFVPGLSRWIEVKMIATPPTLIKYTSNHKGAMYGWASIPEQVGNHATKNPFGIEGLHLVGHWSDIPTGHSGIATVVASGRSTARVILRGRKALVRV